MYSCISDITFAISCESFVMLHNSSWLKSGVICLHSNIWLITFPRFDGPARLSVYSMVRTKIGRTLKSGISTRKGRPMRLERKWTAVGRIFGKTTKIFWNSTKIIVNYWINAIFTSMRLKKISNENSLSNVMTDKMFSIFIYSEKSIHCHNTLYLLWNNIYSNNFVEEFRKKSAETYYFKSGDKNLKFRLRFIGHWVWLIISHCFLKRSNAFSFLSFPRWRKISFALCGQISSRCRTTLHCIQWFFCAFKMNWVKHKWKCMYLP